MNTIEKLKEMDNEFEKIKEVAFTELTEKMEELSNIIKNDENLMKQLEVALDEMGDCTIPVEWTNISCDYLSSDYTHSFFLFKIDEDGNIFVEEGMFESDCDCNGGLKKAIGYMEIEDMIQAYQILDRAIADAKNGELHYEM